MVENLNKVRRCRVLFLWDVCSSQNLVDQDEYPAAQQIHERCIASPNPFLSLQRN